MVPRIVVNLLTSLLPLLVAVLLPLLPSAAYARGRRAVSLWYAPLATFATNAYLLTDSIVRARIGSYYVSPPPVWGGVDPTSAQLGFVLLAAGVTGYGIRADDTRALVGATALLVAFTFGVPLPFWYWPLFPLGVVLLWAAHARTTGGPARPSARRRAPIWGSGPALAALAFPFVGDDSAGYVAVTLVLWGASYLLVARGDRAAGRDARTDPTAG